MKHAPVLSSEEAFALNQAVLRRIQVLQDRMVTFHLEGNIQGLQHDARQVALLWGIYNKVNHAWTHGVWPEEKSVRAS